MKLAVQAQQASAESVTIFAPLAQRQTSRRQRVQPAARGSTVATGRHVWHAIAQATTLQMRSAVVSVVTAPQLRRRARHAKVAMLGALGLVGCVVLVARERSQMQMRHHVWHAQKAELESEAHAHYVQLEGSPILS